jgi:hypothetical protein
MLLKSGEDRKVQKRKSAAQAVTRNFKGLQFGNMPANGVSGFAANCPNASARLFNRRKKS